MGHQHTDHACCGCSSKGSSLSQKGAAVRHWARLRFSALLLLPLILWLIFAIVPLIGADHAAFTAWLGAPVNAGLMSLLILTGCYHGALGVQEIIEDYVSNEKSAHCAIMAEKTGFALVAAICLMAIAAIAL